MNKLLKDDLKYIWHPYTQMKDLIKTPPTAADIPILITKAKGIKLYTGGMSTAGGMSAAGEGKFYYDTISSWWCNVHGHNHPKIKEAIKKQLNSLDHVLFAGFTHKPAIKLSQKLIFIAPGKLSKVFFSDNGSTSVETALKMSFQYWQNINKKKKKKFISLDLSYHGDTIGAMSVGSIDLFNKVFSPLFFPSFKVVSPYCYRCPVKKERATCNIDCLKPLEKLLKEKRNEISALILEPLILAAGGMIVYPKEYLQKAADLVKKYNVHLILDEVATGFGRTGRMFASEYVDIHPDFLCLSKGITSGTLPLGATLTTEEIFNAFLKEKKAFYHGHTYTANPVSCAAGLASLRIFEEEDTLNKIKELIPRLRDGIMEFKTLPIVGDVRHIGMIGAVELVKDEKTKLPFSFKENIGMKVYKKGLKEGIILRPLGNVIYLWLPLSTKKSELDIILRKTFKALNFHP